MQVKSIFLEPSHCGTSEIEITVSIVSTHICHGRGLTLQDVQTSDFLFYFISFFFFLVCLFFVVVLLLLLFFAVRLINICLTAVPKDALSFCLFFLIFL